MRKKRVEGAVSEAVLKHLKLAGRRVFLKGDDDVRRGCLKGRPWGSVEGAASETVWKHVGLAGQCVLLKGDNGIAGSVV